VRLNASNSALLVSLFVLATLSIGLKAAGPTEDTSRAAKRSDLESDIASKLQAQGFSTRITPQGGQPSIILARRGDCTLMVRDARAGAAIASLYTTDAKGIGQVRYLYRGATFDAPPGTRLWLDHFQDKLYNRLEIPRLIPVAVALASSPACNGQSFGLSDVRISS
jgi:hypothetical protein